MELVNVASVSKETQCESVGLGSQPMSQQREHYVKILLDLKRSPMYPKGSDVERATEKRASEAETVAMQPLVRRRERPCETLLDACSAILAVG